MQHQRQVFFYFFATLVGAQGVAAEYGETAEVEKPLTSSNELDASASGTTVSISEGARLAHDLRNVLPDAPGAHIFSLGPRASFVGVSLRGAETQGTRVLLDDLPLGNVDRGALDLSLIPLSVVDHLEVYRGGAPLWLGEGSVGGVLRLIPRTAVSNAIGASLAVGSFGYWDGQVEGSFANTHGNFLSLVRVTGAQDNYPYTNQGPTIADPRDDTRSRLQNAEYREVDAFLQGQARWSQWKLRALTMLSDRQGGAPGKDIRPAFYTEQHRTRLYSVLSMDREGESQARKIPYRVQFGLAPSFERDQFSDPFGELGFSAEESDDRLASVKARVAWFVEPTRWFRLTQVNVIERDRTRFSDELSGADPTEADYWSTTAGIEPMFQVKAGAVRLELRPSAKITWTRISGKVFNLGAFQEADVDNVFATWRVGAAIAPVQWLTIGGSVYQGVRAPSSTELFGQEGGILPNVDLKPQKSLGYDASLLLAGKRERVRGNLEVRGFFTRYSDNIHFILIDNQDAGRYENVALVRVAGIESSGELGLLAHVTLKESLTWQRSRDERTGRALTLLPEWLARVRIEGDTGRLSSFVDAIYLYAETTYVASFFHDAANLVELPARTWFSVGVGLRVWEKSVTFAFAAEDLFDQAGRDYLGYPLPGRRYAGSVAYRKEFVR